MFRKPASMRPEPSGSPPTTRAWALVASKARAQALRNTSCPFQWHQTGHQTDQGDIPGQPVAPAESPVIGRGRETVGVQAFGRQGDAPVFIAQVRDALGHVPGHGPTPGRRPWPASLPPGRDTRRFGHEITHGIRARLAARITASCYEDAVVALKDVHAIFPDVAQDGRGEAPAGGEVVHEERGHCLRGSRAGGAGIFPGRRPSRSASASAKHPPAAPRPWARSGLGDRRSAGALRIFRDRAWTAGFPNWSGRPRIRPRSR